MGRLRARYHHYRKPDAVSSPVPISPDITKSIRRKFFEFQKLSRRGCSTRSRRCHKLRSPPLTAMRWGGGFELALCLRFHPRRRTGQVGIAGDQTRTPARVAAVRSACPRLVGAMAGKRNYPERSDDFGPPRLCVMARPWKSAPTTGLCAGRSSWRNPYRNRRRSRSPRGKRVVNDGLDAALSASLNA